MSQSGKNATRQRGRCPQTPHASQTTLKPPPRPVTNSALLSHQAVLAGPHHRILHQLLQLGRVCCHSCRCRHVLRRCQALLLGGDRSAPMYCPSLLRFGGVHRPPGCLGAAGCLCRHGWAHCLRRGS